MSDSSLEAELDKEFGALFLSNGANLRTTEVAKILGTCRATISRYKNEGIGNCDDNTLARLDTLLKVVKKAMQAKDLPLENKDIRGKNSRLAALRHILRKHHKTN